MSALNQMKTIDIDVAVKSHDQLGEGPIWDWRCDRLYWLDIEGMVLHRYEPAKGAHYAHDLGFMPGSLHLCSDEGVVLLTNASGLICVDVQSGEINNRGKPFGLPNGVRFNDGRTDPRGRIWAGTLAFDFKDGAGVLMRVDGLDRAETVLTQLTIANGLAWTEDGGTLYHIDSPRRSVHAYPFDVELGRVDAGREVLSFTDAGAVPDGMCIDAEGMLWIAFYNGGCVRRYDPITKQLLADISLPARQITSCCLGGKDMNELYITSARHGLDANELAAQPDAGSLFRVRVDTPGVREEICSDRFLPASSLRH